MFGEGNWEQSWEQFYQDLRLYWASEEKFHLMNVKDQYKTFAKLLRKSVVKGNLEDEKLCKEILKDLKTEMEELDARIRDLTGVASRHIRFVSDGFRKDGRRAGDTIKDITNVIKQNLRVKPRTNVRYRRKDESGKIDTSHAGGNGCGKAGV